MNVYIYQTSWEGGLNTARQSNTPSRARVRKKSKCSVFSDSFVIPWTVALLGSFVHGIFQARMLEWVVIPHSRDLPYPGIEPKSTASPALAGGFLTTSTTWEAQRRARELELFIFLIWSWGSCSVSGECSLGLPGETLCSPQRIQKSYRYLYLKFPFYRLSS